MNFTQIVYLVLIFLAVFIVMLVILYQFNPSQFQSRLKKLDETVALKAEGPSWVSRIVTLSGPLAKLSVPEEGWENSALRTRFMNAGYRKGAAPVLYFAAKSVLVILLPTLAALYISLLGSELTPVTMTFVLLILANFGYFLPNMLLEKRITNRKRDIFDSFPDAIDLTTVCIEAGLGLDAAFARVANELRAKNEMLGDELHLVNLELRAGSSRERALRNLALRTGVKEIESLVAILVQSDRFGTSVADALRVHSENLRTLRRQRAEEAAAKIPLKLLFPVIFFIFPTLLLVLLGPAFITISRVMLPTMGS